MIRKAEHSLQIRSFNTNTTQKLWMFFICFVQEVDSNGIVSSAPTSSSIMCMLWARQEPLLAVTRYMNSTLLIMSDASLEDPPIMTKTLAYIAVLL
jgi:hypothetical protein